jgi:hypothetical protein
MGSILGLAWGTLQAIGASSDDDPVGPGYLTLGIGRYAEAALEEFLWAWLRISHTGRSRHHACNHREDEAPIHLVPPSWRCHRSEPSDRFIYGNSVRPRRFIRSRQSALFRSGLGGAAAR